MGVFVGRWAVRRWCLVGYLVPVNYPENRGELKAEELPFGAYFYPELILNMKDPKLAN